MYKDGDREGHGKQYFRNGDVYTGGFKGLYRNGYGELIYLNGRSYCGK